MTFTFYQIFTIIVLHFVYDFIFQSHWMASNKSKCNKALGLHVSTYTVGLVTMACLHYHTFTPYTALLWVIVNSVAHFVTDYFTSRVSSKLFNKDWHNFFVVIGLDQFLHYLTLFGTMKLIVDTL